MILCIWRVQDHYAIVALQMFLYAFKGFTGVSVIQSDPCHDAHSLRFDVDLSFIADLASHRL